MKLETHTKVILLAIGGAMVLSSVAYPYMLNAAWGYTAILVLITNLFNFQ